MRDLISFVVIISLSVLLFTNSNAQNFSVENYKAFLTTHQNMSTEDLLRMYPANKFLENIKSNSESAIYFDSIDTYYNLTDYEKSLLETHGFMVSERLSNISFGQAFLEIFHHDLPVFISTDAILHAFHVSYDRILKDVETAMLLDKLTGILQSLKNSIPKLENKYSSNPEMLTMLKDVDVYVTVPLKLLEQNVNPYYPDNQEMIDSILFWIDREKSDKSIIFSNNCRIIDWSQFKPRGHYTDDGFTGSSLEGYFRAMMWLGRIELYLLPPSSAPVECPPQTFEDIQRQTIDALLIKELFDMAGIESQYEEMENVLKFFVGDPDNVTLPDLDYLKDAVSLNNANQLLDSLKLVEFQDTLKNQSFAYQLILSQILFSDPMSPDSIIPASAFMLFGQRFVIDSYVTGSVVYDRIKYLGEKICRLFPSTLDVLFALGNDATAQLLMDELDQYHYSSNLAALRYLIDNYNMDFWESTLYSSWLNSIKKLNPPTDRSSLPAFMQTAAYWQEKINTQLSSWTELRHDNLLYAKQSYTGGWICSYPYSFVEPFPELYNNLKLICDHASSYFNGLSFPDEGIKANIVDFFNEFSSTTDTLMLISQKELNGEQFTNQEISFLKSMLFENNMCGIFYNGWYARLFYNDEFVGENGGYKGLMESDNIVADIHTTPTDCGGAMIGAITHVGTGAMNLAVVITKNNEGDRTAFIGPVMSYYEYTTTNFLRLTDAEWSSTYLRDGLRPDWVNIYLVDSTGNSKGEGRSLLTSVERDNLPITPTNELLVRNYPNPFNPTTIISFTIPYDLTNSDVSLNIYDIQGKLIRILVNERLPAGNYLTKWDGKNDIGYPVSSGVYIYHLEAAERYVSGKMMLLR